MPSIIGHENALRTTGTIVAFHDGSFNYGDMDDGPLTKSSPYIEIEFVDLEGAPAVGHVNQTKERNPRTMKVSQEVEIEYWDISEEKKAVLNAGMSMVTTMLAGMLRLIGLRNVSEMVVERAETEDGRRYYQVDIVS